MEIAHSDETTAISDDELKSLANAVQRRHGIDFSCYEPGFLKDRIARALPAFKINSIHELWTALLKDHSFIYPFMDEISASLTAMFHDPGLWKKIKGMLEEELKARGGLAIWHAACSTGEEVYTMGIVQKEAGYSKPVMAHATDINKQTMGMAKRGEYQKAKLEEYEQNYKEYNPPGSLAKYYQENGNLAKMDTTLISHVEFNYHNLITSAFTYQYDIIFCRNVMVYLDNGTKQKLFEKFHQSLNENGLLIIGVYDADLSLIDNTKFKILDLDARIFQKISRS